MPDTALPDLIARAEAGDKDARQALYKLAARADDVKLSEAEIMILGLDTGWQNRGAEEALDEAAKRQFLNIRSSRLPGAQRMAMYPFIPRINRRALALFMDILNKRILSAGMELPAEYDRPEFRNLTQ